MNIDMVDICGFVPAIRGMRNRFDSHDNSDTDLMTVKGAYLNPMANPYNIIVRDMPLIGENDLALATKLTKAGEPHCKFRRMIQVWADVEAPLYWWKQYDTYKVGTTANSESTMHNVTDKEFIFDNFVIPESFENDGIWTDVIEKLNYYRSKYLEAKEQGDKNTMDFCFHLIICLLPESWIQMRTICLNYAVLAAIYRDRHNHKLGEWHEFCEFIKALPYAEDLIYGQYETKTD